MGVLDIKRRVLFPMFCVPDLKRFLLLFIENEVLKNTRRIDETSNTRFV